MAKSGTKVKALALPSVRASFFRMQGRAERMAARLRRDAETLVKRGRVELGREVRDLERRVVRGFHAATEQQVGRLERRIASLERTVAALQRRSGMGNERTA